MVGDEDLRFRSCYAAWPAKKFGMGVRAGRASCAGGGEAVETTR